MADVGKRQGQEAKAMVASVDKEQEQQRLKAYAQGRAEYDGVAGYFQAVAQTGVARFEWPVVREAVWRRATQLGERLKDDAIVDQNHADDSNSNSQAAGKKHMVADQELAAKLKIALADLPQPPFTIQRIFEMLTDETTLTLRRSRFWQNLLQLCRVTVTVSPRPETFDFAMKPRWEEGKVAMATIKEGDPGDEEKQDAVGFPLMEADEDDSLPLTQQERLLSTVLEQDGDEQQQDAGKEGQERDVKTAGDADDQQRQKEQDTADADQGGAQADGSLPAGATAAPASGGDSSSRSDEAPAAAHAEADVLKPTSSATGHKKAEIQGGRAIGDDDKPTARRVASESDSTAGPPMKVAKQGTAL